jgi:hypothetical protein
MRTRCHLQAPVWAVLLATAAICAQTQASWAQDVKPTKTKKPPSACVGLDQSVCGAKTECYWRKAALMKNGKTRRAHCRIRRSASKSGPA